MEKSNIAILDGFTVNPGDLSWDAFKEMGNLIVYDRTAPSEVVERAADADIVLTNKVVLDRAVIESLPRLKYIGVLATGYNVVDLQAAASRGVVVTNIPAYSSDSVAQMTFAHILNITNRVEHYAQLNANGRWTVNPDFCYWDTPLTELSGKVLGVVGLGNIGSKVARIARDFGMDVFALTSKDSTSLPEGIQKTTLDGLLAVSDVITLPCPLNDNTREIICAKTIAKMKQGAIVINTGRGPLVNEDDVAEALNSGHLGGYGADVLFSEPPTPDNPLLQAPNAYITPHIAWATTEARIRLVEAAAQNVKAFLEGAPVNVVNL